MKLFTFRDNEHYVEAQRRITLTKCGRGDDGGQFATAAVAEFMWFFHPHPVQNGLCHGVRRGKELDLFRNVFPASTWIGTELVAELCNGEDVFHFDFHDLKPDWLGKFDVVYSNSLDHSHTPSLAVERWLEQVSRPHGTLYIEWSRWHNSCCKDNEADCFAASKEEYLELLSGCGEVVGVHRVQRRTIFIVKP